MAWKAEYKKKLMSADEAAARFVDRVDYWSLQSGFSIPGAFAAAMGRRVEAGELEHIKIAQGYALALHDYFKPEFKDVFEVLTIFMGPAERYAQQIGTVDYVPTHLSNTEPWFNYDEIRKIAQVVTPPDENGYMNRSCFGGLLSKQIFDDATEIVVEINENTPWTCGVDQQIHVSECSAIIENNFPLLEVPEIEITEVEQKLAAIIVDMIPDGATIQLGMGGLANSIGHFLKDKKHLGIHSEILTNSIMDLIKSGAVDCSKKNFYPGKVAYGFSVGTKALYDFLHRNDFLEVVPMVHLNNPNIIAKNDNLISVNNALMVDLTGQAGSETLGTRQYSATRGQVNFVLGAQASKNGQSILALPSTHTNKEGVKTSRILPTFPNGTITTTTRNDVDWIVTEFGARKLKYKSIAWRVKNLIAIAHPDFRDELTFQAKQIGWLR